MIDPGKLSKFVIYGSRFSLIVIFGSGVVSFIMDGSFFLGPLFASFFVVPFGIILSLCYWYLRHQGFSFITSDLRKWYFINLVFFILEFALMLFFMASFSLTIM